MSIETLRRSLVANAAFSGLTGIITLVMAPSLAESLGPPAWSLRAVGAGLVVFAAMVGREARAPGRRGTRQIVAADLAWIATAAALVAASPAWLTEAGRAVLATVTIVVAALAMAQRRGLDATS